ncbi:MAG: 4-alpha-glucanotransferase [Maritimibacter sp.]
MDGHALDALCWASGITTGYDGRAVPDATKVKLLTALGVPLNTPPDQAPVPDFHADPAAAGACPLPDWLDGSPAWGLFCQLYELRSDRSWGIGDFRDLADLMRIAAEAGADFVGINPLHALFLANPKRISPFTPSNRRFLNPLYIAMDDLPAATRPDKSALAKVQQADLVDYAGVTALKLKGLSAVFSRAPFDDDRYQESDFEAFCDAGGDALHRHALFETLSLDMVSQGYGDGWHSWPAEYRDVESELVASYAIRHASALRFHCWLQWVANIQLGAVRATALEAGMRIGLYLDLAVAEATDGSATWANPGTAMRGVVVGAHPDVFAQDGQNWDLAAFSPTALAAQDYEPFRALIKAQLDHAGALRIDHVMALRQLYLIPEGESPATGTHVAYPFAEMLNVVADEARQHSSIMIGEDLGWVPDGFRDVMQAANVFTYRILYFEQDWGMFTRPSTYPDKALACISTHDLPTLTGWWQGNDITARLDYGLISPEKAADDRARRHNERYALINALVDAGKLAPGECDGGTAELPEGLLAAAYAFIGETPSRLVAVRLADLIGPEDQTNVPGTMDEHPNWQRRAPVAVDKIATTKAFQDVTRTMRQVRPQQG